MKIFVTNTIDEDDKKPSASTSTKKKIFSTKNKSKTTNLIWDFISISFSKAFVLDNVWKMLSLPFIF